MMIWTACASRTTNDGDDGDAASGPSARERRFARDTAAEGEPEGSDEEEAVAEADAALALAADDDEDI
jgi:hypothetical protein